MKYYIDECDLFNNLISRSIKSEYPIINRFL